MEFFQLFCFCLFVGISVYILLNLESCYREGALSGALVILFGLFLCSPIPYSFKERQITQSEIIPFELIQGGNQLRVLLNKESLHSINDFATGFTLLNHPCIAYKQTWEQKYGFQRKIKVVRFFDAKGNLILER